MPLRAAQSASPAARAPRSGVAGPGTWSTFWHEFAAEDTPAERCYIPGDGRLAADAHWLRFAERLPHRARVLDLGCGAGAVGRSLLGRRGDLAVTGIDWAEVPAVQVANLNLLQGVRMEALPFGDACFDAAVSLFGTEYGDIDETARELGRVLRPGSPFSFLVHHADSAILKEGVPQRRALHELIAGRTRTAFLAGSVTGIEQQRQRLSARFPAEPVTDLISDYCRREITRPRAERQALWDKLAADFEPEVLLLLHLERSAKTSGSMGVWLAPLLATMSGVGASVLRDSAGAPVAWSVGGVR